MLQLKFTYSAVIYALAIKDIKLLSVPVLGPDIVAEVARDFLIGKAVRSAEFLQNVVSVVWDESWPRHELRVIERYKRRNPQL